MQISFRADETQPRCHTESIQKVIVASKESAWIKHGTFSNWRSGGLRLFEIACTLGYKFFDQWTVNLHTAKKKNRGWWSTKNRKYENEQIEDSTCQIFMKPEPACRESRSMERCCFEFRKIAKKKTMLLWGSCRFQKGEPHNKFELMRSEKIEFSWRLQLPLRLTIGSYWAGSYRAKSQSWSSLPMRKWWIGFCLNSKPIAFKGQSQLYQRLKLI